MIRESNKTQLRLELREEHPDNLACMAARGDYLSESLVGKTYEEVMEGTDKDQQEFLDDLMYRGHFGPTEHTSPAFFIEGLSRVAMAQLTRHRHLSFDVQSQRYVDFSEKDPVIPPSFEENYMGGVRADAVLKGTWNDCISRYQLACESGIPKEDARFFLPQATPVNMTMSGNNRALMHLMDLRNSGAAQWEARDFSQLMYDELKDYAPKTFQAYEDKTSKNSLRAP